MVNWNNAPEWADQHSVVGTNRDSIWFNDTKYAYCQMPDNIFGFNTSGVPGQFNWQQSEIRDVTERPTTAYSVDWNNAPEWATMHWYYRDRAHCIGGDYYAKADGSENTQCASSDLKWDSVTHRPASPKVTDGVTFSVLTNKIYYIAGPMSGLPNFNRDAFNAAAAKLTTAGHTALNPATLPDGLSQAQYMDICLAMLRCATHVQMLRGWDDSRGAFAERALALKLGLTVEYV